MRVVLAERTSCRHGMRLNEECGICAKTPEVPRTYFPSDELDGLPLGTPEEERWRAKQWMDTAAQHARGEEYYRVERDKLLRVVQLAIGRIHGVSSELQEVWDGNWRLLYEQASLRAPLTVNTDSGGLSMVEPVKSQEPS